MKITQQLRGPNSYLPHLLNVYYLQVEENEEKETILKLINMTETLLDFESTTGTYISLQAQMGFLFLYLDLWESSPFLRNLNIDIDFFLSEKVKK